MNIVFPNLLDIIKGGPGSGNFGHAGRPGEVGGSGDDDNNVVNEGYIASNRDKLNKQIKSWKDKNAKGIASLAIDDADSRSVIAYTNKEDQLTAIASYMVTPSGQISEDGNLKVLNLASNKKGDGTKVMNDLAIVARGSNIGISLISEKGAVGFYEKLGMNKRSGNPGGGALFSWSKEEVKAFCEKKAIKDEPIDGCYVKTEKNEKSFVSNILAKEAKNGNPGQDQK